MSTFVTQPMIQFLALGFTAFSTFFFMREVMVASPEISAGLAKSKGDYNLNLAKIFSSQKIDGIFGFSFLMISVFLQGINLLFPVRFIDLEGLSPCELLVLGSILVIIFIVSNRVNKILVLKKESKILEVLKQGNA